MKLSLFIIWLVAIAGALAQDEQSPAPAPAPQAEENQGVGDENIVIVTNPTTTPAPPTSPSPVTPSAETSPTPNPTTPSPSPSPSPSTPTPPPNTPTPNPTPTPTNPNPTTTTSPSSAAPTTSRSPVSPIPTAAPAPPAFPNNVGNWSVSDGATPCILLTGALQVHLADDNTTNLVIDVPNTLEHVNVSGSCAPERQTLALNWWSKLDQGERENTLRLEFSKEGSDTQYALSAVSFKFSEVTPDTSRDKNAQITGQFFLTSLNHSFECIANQRVELSEAKLYLLTEKLQFEAFRENGGPLEPYRFSEAEQCKADHHISTGTMLWIAIGIGLAIVACIALAVYLIKRCRRDGYQPLETQT